MACGQKGNCDKAYRKPGKNTLHCEIQTANGGKWDFCAHQYFCQNSKRYELSKEANDCPLPQKEAEKAKEQAKAAVAEAENAIAEAEQVFAEELAPKIKVEKKSASSKKKAVKSDGN